MHYIKASIIKEIILKAIQEITTFAKEGEEEFLKKVRKLSDERGKKD